ncbi:MAG: STAS domain-containing protein [Pseudonocardiaceae bacterium]
MGDDGWTGRVRVNGEPMFEVAVRSGAVGSWVVLRGELDLAGAPRLEQVLDRLCQDGGPEVVLDLSGLDYLGAAGLGVFLDADDSLRAAGGRLILHRPGRLARWILKITGLDTVLIIRPATSPSLDRAAASRIDQAS